MYIIGLNNTKTDYFLTTVFSRTNKKDIIDLLSRKDIT